MPYGQVLHEGDALALRCFSDDCSWLRARGQDCFAQRVVIMAIDNSGVPTKSFKFCIQRVEAICFFSQSSLLQSISVNDARQAGQFLVSGKHNCFPIAAFLELTVPGDNVSIPIGIYDSRPNRHSHRYRQTMPEWSSARFNTGKFGAGRVTVETGITLRKSHQLVMRQEAIQSHGRIQRHRRVTLTHDQPVTIGPLRSFGI